MGVGLESDTHILQHLSPEDHNDNDIDIDTNNIDENLDIFDEKNPFIFRIVLCRKSFI